MAAPKYWNNCEVIQQNESEVSKLKIQFSQFDIQWIWYVFPDIEYSDETMQKAISLANQISSFLNDSDAYVKGQLVCQPIDEPLLMQRYVGYVHVWISK